MKGELPVWSAERSITTDQLLRKRAEFWDTSPAYEGRKEIWDALKAAAEALESGNRDLAQAILDGASITLPTGAYCLFVCLEFGNWDLAQAILDGASITLSTGVYCLFVCLFRVRK